jgi:hypothetical protein
MAVFATPNPKKTIQVDFPLEKIKKLFDLLKLEHLTIDYLGNHYNYKLRVAVIFGTKGNAGNMK